jgi:protein-S-isoprenylcysteine O-methyltransferase Ste14
MSAPILATKLYIPPPRPGIVSRKRLVERLNECLESGYRLTLISAGEKTMDPKIIIIIAVSYLYGFFEVFMNLRRRSKSKVTTSNDKSSLWGLYGLITLGYALSFAIGATRIGRIYAWNTFFTIGMALFVFGLLIRIHALRTLRQYFTYSVAKVENHQIVETGLYKFIRHPGYLGQLIIFLGISTSISNWLSILVMMIPVTLGYLYRIKVEESFMLEQLGEVYLNYRARTKRIIPRVY